LIVKLDDPETAKYQFILLHHKRLSCLLFENKMINKINKDLLHVLFIMNTHF